MLHGYVLSGFHDQWVIDIDNTLPYENRLSHATGPPQSLGYEKRRQKKMP
jgi:hypothetical protein